ncbi:HpcH/HpaI aldolase family protein [Persicitalea jodogahamensis]|uniref:2,4-dihydroxyhept-2-ene-1,7-dioic acid aldolase n=1 Tax=Persicitalea jodogahamensis TaxID=402147 RepID=A0A8J3DD53_9BACT|nr:aldolase/citrate lyase family protein [Persicitalea jodogahamensis]GHB84760.1 2,4-dihydroxyhept-2-ene-1,7-dioic acid aldolase [Persicitalea jodogahamensis]
MTSNSLKKRWRDGEITINGWLCIPTSWTAEVMAHAGFDTLTIDAQHGLATDLTAILPMLQAIATTDTVPLVRVAWNDPAQHMRMLDAGAQGIICPMLNTRAETEAFVQACRYPPQGYRSIGPLRASLGDEAGYLRKANDEVLTMAMIETADGYRNLEDIAQTPTLDALYVGTWDLCMTMGLEKMADFDDPVLLGMLDTILNVAAKNNIMAAVHCGTPENAIKMREMGFQMVTPLTDTFSLQQAIAEGLRKLRD